MSANVVLVERRGKVVWVTLNRPEARNALSGEVLRAIDAAVAGLIEDHDVRAVVVTGAGDKAFCAGADLKERMVMDTEQTYERIELINNAFNQLAALPKPTLCALNGSAYGGGLELALTCDFRIAVDTAELGLTEVRLGIMPGAGGTQRLPRVVGVARAKEMILLGRRISAQRAYEIGLINEVVPPGQLGAAVDRWLAELDGCAPVSVTVAKEAIDKGWDQPLDEGLQTERGCYDATLRTEDRDEGLRAFNEKRPPRYQGQ